MCFCMIKTCGNDGGFGEGGCFVVNVVVVTMSALVLLACLSDAMGQR